MGYCQQNCRVTAKPSWLQATLADLEQKFDTISINNAESEESDSFAARAENYYEKRPQLLALLHDLYGRYLSLADRYVQALAKPQPAQPQHSRSLSQVSLIPSDLDDADTVVTELTDPYASDTDSSSLTFQHHPLPPPASSLDDMIVTELVSQSVENELLKHEIAMLERHQDESNRKMELQKSLVEVLESERMVLLSENARLAVRVDAVAEENEALAAEVGFLRRKAGELARLVVKLREGHRVCALGRQIEALQAQIYGLEKRNRECYEAMARREEEKAELLRGMCVELDRLKAENRRLKEEAAAAAKSGEGRARRWGRHVARAVEGLVVCGCHAGKGKEEGKAVGWW